MPHIATFIADMGVNARQKRNSLQEAPIIAQGFEMTQKDAKIQELEIRNPKNLRTRTLDK